MPPIERSETDDTSRDDRALRYAVATSSESDFTSPRLPAAPRLHLLDEFLEQHVRVVGPGRRFGMELRCEDRQRPVTETFERPVVQVDVRGLDVGGEALPFDSKPVVLRRDRHHAARNVLHRVVRTPMPELELERGAAERE